MKPFLKIGYSFFSLLCLSCTKPNNDSARTFFDFVCRECNHLQVTVYHTPEQIGRTEPSRPQSSASSRNHSVFLYLELVPWSPEDKPQIEDIYSRSWISEGDPFVEESILSFYRKEEVRSFEHIEYRKEGLSNIEIFSSRRWAFFSGDGDSIVQIEPGDSLIDLFDVIRIHKEYETGFDDLLIGKNGKVISVLPDRIPLTEYLQQETKAFSDLCLFLKEDVGYVNEMTIRVTLDSGRILEYYSYAY